MPKGYIRVDEAAEQLGIPARTVRWLLLNKRLKGEKVGRDWLVDEKAVKAYKVKNRDAPPA